MYNEYALLIWNYIHFIFAYNIGPGKPIPWKNRDAPGQEKVSSVMIKDSDVSKPTSRFVPVKPSRTTNPPSRSEKEGCSQKSPADADQETQKEEQDQ